MNINLNYLISFSLLFYIPQLTQIENNFKLLDNIAILNLQPLQKSYTATAQFWGRLATGVKQPSTVTLYPNQENRLLVIIILSQKCGRFFEIYDQKIKKVTYSCPQEEKDESGDYTNWKVERNSLTKEVKMIAPATNNNTLYIRNEAFWLIKY
ncbi:hypothetical protein [Crocosphaera chwakensis]|uniref:Uncharacterized protein n=1 Tax=Crocosphaera chwakensis CCY0110 TaxID=391612 RepID=A3IXI2_9CHRO|nr:hypothetical protein [Crocosphaera chwakensis]EAZ88829.1 hypothetical protein CY0110_11942 [Crocosphaera chwakensis CCY0110]